MKKSSITKKYKVSLALKIPRNFEVEVKARGRKEAFVEAREMFNEFRHSEDYITEPDYANIELDINTKGSIDATGSGIDIKEIE